MAGRGRRPDAGHHPLRAIGPGGGAVLGAVGEPAVVCVYVPAVLAYCGGAFGEAGGGGAGGEMFYLVSIP